MPLKSTTYPHHHGGQTSALQLLSPLPLIDACQRVISWLKVLAILGCIVSCELISSWFCTHQKWLGFKQLWQGCVQEWQSSSALTKAGLTGEYLLTRLAGGYLVLSGQPQFAFLVLKLISRTLSSKASLKLYCAVSPAPKAPVLKLFRCDYVYCYLSRTVMLLVHGHVPFETDKVVSLM